MQVIFAGQWNGPNLKAFNGKEVAVLFGGPTAHHGARLGEPVTVTQDPEGPLHLSIIGEWYADVADSIRAECKKGRACVIIEGTRDEIIAIARADGFGRPFRLTYPTP